MMLDASAVLSIVLQEPGAERAEEALAGASMSIVNLAEVFDAVRRKRIDAPREGIDKMLRDAGVRLVCPAETTARLAADMMAADLPPGRGKISLGDGFCLGHAVESGMPALTADRAWAEAVFPHPVEIRLIR